MANNRLAYLSLVWSVVEGFDNSLDNAVSNADTGENSSVDEGKSDAIDKVDDIISTLQEFRMDIKKLSLKGLKAKY